MQSKSIIVWLIVALFIVSVAVALLQSIYVLGESKPQIISTGEDVDYTIKEGDIIELNYTVRLTNGNLIETTDLETARKSGIYNPNKSYVPLTLTINSNEIIPGLSEALLGLKAGNRKTVEIPPEKAYGELDPNLIQAITRIQSSPRTQTSTIEKFMEIFEKAPETGKVYQLPTMNLTVTVLSIDSTNVTYRYDLKSNTKFDTQFGKADVVVNEDEIQIILPGAVGQLVETEAGVARIREATNETIFIDFNHELAGETLVFDIEIVSIQSSGVTLKYFWSKYCGYCKIQDPILVEFLQEHPTLNFVLIDVNKPESSSEMVKYRAFGTPTFILKKGPTEIKVGGLQQKEELEALICPKLQDEMCLTGETKERRNIKKWW